MNQAPNQDSNELTDLFDQRIILYIEKMFNDYQIDASSITISENPNESQVDHHDPILNKFHFKRLLASLFTSSSKAMIETIYRAVDVTDSGTVKYSDFTNYLVSIEAMTSYIYNISKDDVLNNNNNGKGNSKSQANKLVWFNSQIHSNNVENNKISNVFYKDVIDCLCIIKKPHSMLISGGRDGQIFVWDPVELTLLKTIRHKTKSDIMNDEINTSMDSLLRAYCMKNKARSGTHASEHNAITSLAPLLTTGLLCVGSADCCVTIYELTNLEVCGRFQNAGNIPSAIHCFLSAESLNTTTTIITTSDTTNQGKPTQPGLTNKKTIVEKPCIAIGDAGGYLHLIHLDPEFLISAEAGMRKKNQLIFSESLENFYTKVKIHDGWITQISFIHEVNYLLTSSSDGFIHYYDIAHAQVIKSFPGHRGRKNANLCFSWSNYGKFIVSGGDREILFWDPFTLEIIMKMDGSNINSPILRIEVVDEAQKIFISTNNKTVHVLHYLTFEILQSIQDPTVYNPYNFFSAVVFSVEHMTIYVASNAITAFRLERTSENNYILDEEDIVATLYNPLFKQVIVIKSLGLVKVFQSQTGELIRKFQAIPKDSVSGKPMELLRDSVTGILSPLIKKACLDKNYTRLIIISHNQSIQIWNFVDGTNLFQFHPQLYSTALAHIYANHSRNITSMSYEMIPPLLQKSFSPRGTSKPTDLQDSYKRYLFLGTEQGNVCGYLEANTEMDAAPVCFLQTHENKKSSDPDGQSLEKAKTLDDDELRSPETTTHHLHRLSIESGSVHSNNQKNHRSDSLSVGSSRIARMLPSRRSTMMPSINNSKVSGKAVKNNLDSTELSLDDASKDTRTMVEWNQNFNAPNQLSIDSRNMTLSSIRSKILTLTYPWKGDLMHYLAVDLSILWMEYVKLKDFLVVCSNNGRVTLWNLHTNSKIRDLYVYEQDTGPILMCMKKKGSKPSNANRHKSLASVSEMASISSSSPTHQKVSEGNVSSMVPSPPVRAADKKQRDSKGIRNSRLVGSSSGIEEDTTDLPVATKSIEGNSVHSDKGIVQFRRGSITKPLLVAKTNPSGVEGETKEIPLDTADGPPTAVSSIIVVPVERKKSRAMDRDGDDSGSDDDDDDDFGSIEQEEREMERIRNISLQKQSEQKAKRKETISKLLQHSLLTNGQDDSMAMMPGRLLITPRKTTRITSNMFQPVGNGLFNDPNRVESVSNGDRLTPVRPHLPPPSTTTSRTSTSHSENSESNPTISSQNDPSPLLMAEERKAVVEAVKEVKKKQESQPFHRNTSYSTDQMILKLQAQLKLKPRTGDVKMKNIMNQLGLIRGVDSRDGMTMEGNVDRDSTHEKNNPKSLIKNYEMSDGFMKKPESPLNRSVHDSSSFNDEESNSVKVIIDCMVFVTRANLMIGACNDRYIRFWETDSFGVLCSTLYYHRSSGSNPVKKTSDGVDEKRSSPSRSKGDERVQSKQLSVRPSHGMESDDHAVVVPSTPIGSDSHSVSMGMPTVTQSPQHPVDEVIHNMKLSTNEDALIGAYDTGMIRVWMIQHASIVNLKTLLENKLKRSNSSDNAREEKSGKVGSMDGFRFGLSVSPLILMYEWHAHYSPFISIGYVDFQYQLNSADESASMDMDLSHQDTKTDKQLFPNNKGTFENGFLMTAGLDQRVFLWTIAGKCVGEYGSFEWDIADENTWLRHSLHMNDLFKRSHTNSPMSQLPHHNNSLDFKNKSSVYQTDAESINKDNVHLNASPSTRLIQKIGLKSYHNSKELNEYVEALIRKVTSKPPTYGEISKEFKRTMDTYPMAAIQKNSDPILSNPALSETYNANRKAAKEAKLQHADILDEIV